MEFYSGAEKKRPRIRSFNSQRDGILLCPLAFLLCGQECFNSQRDGILQQSSFATSEACRVSIPNGMEFYVATSAFYVDIYLFQFPTGWNSTSGAKIYMLVSAVLIPNGMEFYKNENYFGDYKSCFNSQRDGILPTQINKF